MYHQIRGDWKVESETSKHYVPKIRKKMDGVTLVWIPRSKNKEADRLATKALTETCIFAEDGWAEGGDLVVLRARGDPSSKDLELLGSHRVPLLRHVA